MEASPEQDVEVEVALAEYQVAMILSVVAYAHLGFDAVDVGSRLGD